MGMRTVARHIQQIALILLSPISVLKANLFEAIDRLFKLAGWLMLVVAVTALGKKSGISEVGLIASVLLVLWSMAVMLTAMEITLVVINEINTRYPDGTINDYLRLGILLIVGIASVYWVNADVIPAANRIFEAVLRAVTAT